MQFRTLLALFGGLSTLTRFDAVNAEAVQPPLRIRFNSDLFKSLVNLRDQEIFEAFADINVKAEAPFESLNFSLAPQKGDAEDFDFDINLSKEDFGCSTDNMKVIGTAKLVEGGEFTFTAPISKAKLQYALGQQAVQQVKGIPMEFEQFVWEEQSFNFTVGDIEATGADVSAEVKTALATAIQNYIVEYRALLAKQTPRDIQPIHNQDKLPMDSVLPLALFFYGTQLAETIDFEEPFVSIGASLQNFGLLDDKQKKLLKPLKGQLTKEQNAQGDMAMMQFAIDDNLFNSITSIFTSIETSFSARNMMKNAPKAKPFLQMMTTNIFSQILPQITEEYGEGKKIDLMFSPSHSLFVDGLPGSKMSGVYIDKNGNWKVQANIVINLTAETTPGRPENVRNMYLTLGFKMKIKQDARSPFDKRFIVTPRSLEISQLKVMKGDEEMTTEQMMLQSLANLQMEALKKSFKDLPISLGDIVQKNPKELGCLGFNLSDLDISFQKGQAQLSAYYKNVEKPDKKFCDDFIKTLQDMPKNLEDKVKEATKSPMMQDMQKYAENMKKEKSEEDAADASRHEDL